MLIEEKPLKHWIDHFYGYGSWHAPIWFTAHEDGGGDLPEEVAEKLTYFFQKQTIKEPTLCNIRELYRNSTVRWHGPKADLFANLFDYRFGANAQLSAVWKNLIGFAHGYMGEPLTDLLEYQKTSFTTQREALIKLYPLPSPHNHAWYYSWLDCHSLDF